jgi:hypothetical protein
MVGQGLSRLTLRAEWGRHGWQRAEGASGQMFLSELPTGQPQHREDDSRLQKVSEVVDFSNGLAEHEDQHLGTSVGERTFMAVWCYRGGWTFT